MTKKWSGMLIELFVRFTIDESFSKELTSGRLGDHYAFKIESLLVSNFVPV